MMEELKNKSQQQMKVISSLQKKLQKKIETKDDIDQQIEHLKLLQTLLQEFEDEKEYLDLYEERDQRDIQRQDQEIKDRELHLRQEEEYCGMRRVNPENEYWDM
jgi:hypothetical protein